MSLAPPPNNAPIQDGPEGAQRVTGPWRDFLYELFIIALALRSSGTTANRPTKNLWVGRMFYDTTLEQPIWYTTTDTWITADGTEV